MVRNTWMALCLMLAGCATPPERPILGPETVGPYGWYEYCDRTRFDPDCITKEKAGGLEVDQ